MEMNEQILNLITFLNALQAQGKYTVFYSYSGHVNWFHVEIYKDKWKEKQKPIFEQDYKIRNGIMTIYLLGETSLEQIIQSINEALNQTEKRKKSKKQQLKTR